MARKNSKDNGWVKVEGGSVPDWFCGKDGLDPFNRFERCRQIFLEGFEITESQWTRSRGVIVDTEQIKVVRVSAAFRTAIRQIYDLLYGAVGAVVKAVHGTAQAAVDITAKVLAFPSNQVRYGGQPSLGSV